jgi:hypothetical protein
MNADKQSAVREVDLRTSGMAPSIERPLTASAQLNPIREAIAQNPAKLEAIAANQMKAPVPVGLPVSLPQLERPLTSSANLDHKAPEVQLPNSGAAPIGAMPASSAQASNPAPTPSLPSVATAATQEPNVQNNSGLQNFYELGYEVRHEIPPMPLSMYVYNKQPQHSFIIISGKKYTEGEVIEGKVQVQKIRADGIECEFQGTRFFYPRQAM